MNLMTTIGPIKRNTRSSNAHITSTSTLNSRTNRTSYRRERGRIRTLILFLSLITVLTCTFVWIKSTIESKYEHSELLTSNYSKVGSKIIMSLVTIVLPSVVNPKGRGERLKAIADTWGPSARAVFVVHADEELPLPDSISWIDFDLSKFDMGSTTYPAVLRLPDAITVKQGVERLIYVLKALRYESGPEFSFFVNDHSFVIPEHLCVFLQNYDGEKDDLYAGHALANEELTFNSGASGYVLTKLTLRKLVDAVTEEKSNCTTDNTNHWLSGNPGIMTAKCLGDTLGTPPLDTRTAQGEHIFHAYGLVRAVTGNFDQWYIDKHKRLNFLNNKEINGGANNIPSGKAFFLSC